VDFVRHGYGPAEYRGRMAGTVRAPGDEVGGYTIVRSLGAGGSGHVYLVRDADQAPAALKLVDARADAVAAERLRREVHALQSLRSDAIPRILDAELDDDETFVVFEFIPGDSLAHHVDRHGPLTGEELADFAERVASALTTAHRGGVVHRDVTPSNVMLSPRGAVLIDFGLSHRSEDSRLTRDGLVSGTAGYVAPEVIDGAEPGPIADRWSWAATVAFAMTGEGPFGTGSAAIRKTLAGKPVIANVPGADAVRAALGKDISQRPTMAEVVAALRGATQVVSAMPATKVMPVDLTADEDAEEAVEVEVTDVMALAEPDELWNDADDYYADRWDAGEDAEWSEEAEPRPHRPALLLAWTLTASLAAALAPLLAFLALVLGAWVGRATFRRHQAIVAARAKHGARRRDAVIHTMGLPWHMTRALAELLPSVFAAAIIGAGVAALAWWLVSEEIVAPGTSQGQAWGHAIALFAGALAAAASLWWGLWSLGTREGAHRFAAGLAPSRGVTALWVLVALVASAGIVAAVWLGVTPWWWPLPQMPE
jgi:predicted Ser/Thr protein kinase